MATIYLFALEVLHTQTVLKQKKSWNDCRANIRRHENSNKNSSSVNLTPILIKIYFHLKKRKSLLYDGEKI